MSADIQVISGHYQIIQNLGRGGMAEVFKVWDTERQTYLAAKKLLPQYSHSKNFTNTLEKEAATLAELQHPGIVRFYEVIHDDEDVYIIMDYIDGNTLRQEIKSSGNLALTRVQKIIKVLCSALNYAHSKGIVHCDIKPENILVDQGGNPYLSDFGIALANVTGGTSSAGTPQYMAPEQIRQQTVLPQTDIYSLGVVLYELLTGSRPFDGSHAPSTIMDTDRVKWEHLNLAPPPPSQVNPLLPNTLDRVLLTCLAKQPGSRFKNALDLLNQFESALIPSKEVPPKPVQPEIPPKKQVKQTSFSYWWILAVIVIISGVILLIIAGGPRRPPPPVVPSLTNPTTNPLITLPSNKHCNINACMTWTYQTTPRIDLNECVTGIELMPDGRLKVFFSWEMSSLDTQASVTIAADTNNRNMYLTDNLNNRLDFSEAGGDATRDVKLFTTQSKTGWFIFPSPNPSASYFYFHDDDNSLVTSRLDTCW